MLAKMRASRTSADISDPDWNRTSGVSLRSLGKRLASYVFLWHTTARFASNYDDFQ
jgi:hypothetical protein